MKIKRYLDKDMRQVLRRVREDQGPDAVILSNRRVEGGIEVIAALDYDEALVRNALGSRIADNVAISSDVLADLAESDIAKPAAKEEPAALEVVATNLTAMPVPRLADPEQDSQIADLRTELTSMRGMLETQLSELMWQDSTRRFPVRTQILRNLTRLGIAPDVANTLVDRLGPIDDIKDMWKSPLTMLAKTLPVVEDDLMTHGGTIALIGPTGVGKTTTIAKIAAQFASHHWADDIALVSADSYRIGAREHLTAFANIIGANVYAATNYDELREILERLSDKKLVLIDTEGRSQRDRELSSCLAAYGDNGNRVKFYLTLAATCQEAGLDETIREFSQVPLQGAIVTKIDESAQLGCVMSALIRHGLPAAWLSDGQQIPEDLYRATKKKLWLVNQAVECMEASQPCLDESALAHSFATRELVNA